MWWLESSWGEDHGHRREEEESGKPEARRIRRRKAKGQRIRVRVRRIRVRGLGFVVRGLFVFEILRLPERHSVPFLSHFIHPSVVCLGGGVSRQLALESVSHSVGSCRSFLPLVVVRVRVLGRV